ncbi:MAG TPA: hypothetical protein VGC11_15975, partial [Acidimicrobiia bacterium]
MVTELFTVVALPHSKAVGADFHVSLFVSPQLTPDGTEGRLDDFAYFPNWAALLVKDSVIELSDQAGVIPATPDFGDIDPDDWAGVFPPDTPVRGPQRPDWSNRPWRTFRASEVHDAGKLLHLVAMFSSPTSPPLPSAHPLLRLIAQYGGSEQGYDERVITRTFDGILGEFGEGGGTSPGDWRSLDAIEETLSGLDPFTRTLAEMHRARRFYERPESAGVYQERPDENPVVEKLPRPEPDFHERASFLADHPALQRRLGLVVDVVVDDLDRLAKSEWLSARIEVAGDPAACRTARTRCRPAGDDLVTVARTDDWHDAALRLGDTGQFAVLDMDPDGTALKLDRYLWTLPRLLAVEQNGDPVHAAPTALRSIGFTVARRQKALETVDRMARQHDLAAQVAAFDQPLLDTEDVTQGMRVEVWDDSAGAWFTLHARRIAAEALGAGDLVTDLPEEGFVQGTTATETSGVEEGRVHVHEAMFGWDGWSLAAPRPGKRVRHEDGDEIVEDTELDPDPVTPLVVTNQVEQGTLPRLRYGRSYAFRVWAVDLAGNSRPHALGPPPAPDPADVAAVAAMLPVPPAVARTDVIPALRGAAAAAIVERRQPAEVETVDLHTMLEVHGRPDEVVGRLSARRSGAVGARPVIDRAAIVDRAFEDVVLAEEQPFVAATATYDAGVVTGAFGRPGTVILPTPQQALTISPLRPFLRWDPVQPPVVVARHPLTAGESLRQVVVRSGVTQDLETLEITVVPVAEFAAEHAALGYRRTSERHLVPPKTSQSEAELHGAFDRAIGSTDLGRHQTLLAVAVREAGTLFDVAVPRLDDPLVLDPQPGISLASEPSVPPSLRKTLPLPPGEPPAPGQYVVHDVDDLVVPYLSDVAAAGISLVFPEAGRDRSIPFPFGAEGFTARWRGRWPALRPYRLQLRGAAQLQGRLVGTELRIGLPPGDVQRFRLASSLDPADLDRFGLWRILPEVLRTNPDIVEAAADGWIWAFTPFDEVTLVHAVPRPLEAPRPTTIVPARAGEGATDVFMFGAVDIHGPSTEQLTAEARWVDPVDDLSLPGPEDQERKAVAFTTVIREEEDLSVLATVPVDVR